MTGASLLSLMQILDNELKIASGEADESRALTALQMAQRYYETLAATYPRIGSTASSLTITAVESASWPSSLLRLDSLWMIDTTQTPNRPIYQIDEITDSGGHTMEGPWPIILLSLPVQSPGRPIKFWTDRSSMYWFPFPDASYTARIYGFSAGTSLTSRSVTFSHPDIAADPIAAFAVKLLEMGIDDPTEELDALAAGWFRPVLKALSRFTRTRPQGRTFSRMHST